MQDCKIIGLLDGWRGLIDKKTTDLDLNTVEYIFNEGGTILGTSRTNPYKVEGAVEKCKKKL